MRLQTKNVYGERMVKHELILQKLFILLTFAIFSAGGQLAHQRPRITLKAHTR